jgi:hypothetical protein
MKKLLTICLLIATSFTVNAQELSFEETVKYINDIFKENKIGYHIGGNTSGRFVKGITADKTGKVIIYDLYKGASEESKTDKFDVIMCTINLFDIFLITPRDNDRLYLIAESKITPRPNVGFFILIPAPLAGRLEKALDHLHYLCEKKADPFGN